MNKNIIDEIVEQKNMLSFNLNENEKKEVDIYLDKVLEEMSEVISFIEALDANDEKRKSIANAFKLEIEEQKWLEKLSKTFYEQADTLDLTKIQNQ